MSSPIQSLSDEQPLRNRSTEVCVIGSGCGGATAARVLAEAGREVLLLEEGGDFRGERINQRDAEMYDQLYMDRGGRTTSDLSISVMQGRALGGGTVINNCDVVPIPRGVFALWRRRFGLNDLTEDRMAPFERQAMEDLRASPIPEAEVNLANRLLRQGAEKLGWRGEIMAHNRVGCVGLGTCMLGCPADAKRNMRLEAVPKATAHGAQVLTRARVTRIDGAQSEIKSLLVRALDSKGRREVGELSVRARYVIVAAGAIGSPLLLLRSGIGNDHVGRHLTLQPQLPVTALFDEPPRAFEGIPQSYALTEFYDEDHPDHGHWGFRVEPVMGTPGIVASLLPFNGHAGKRMMTLYDHSAGALVLVPDAPGGGRVHATRSHRPRIEYELAESTARRLREGARAAAQAYLAAGAREVVVPAQPPVRVTGVQDLALIDNIPLSPARAPLISAHQQGTARMAPSGALGAVDPEGRVFGTKGLYIFDSSVFPTGASSHTMVSIIAMSHFLSRQLLTKSRS